MFHEFTLQEIDSLVLIVRGIVYENFQEVKRFKLENPKYVHAHPSGNWYEWERAEIKKIENRFGEDSMFKLKSFIKHVTRSDFDTAEKYYPEVMGIYHAYNTNKMLGAVDLHDKLEDEDSNSDVELPEEFKNLISNVLLQNKLKKYLKK